MSVFTPGGKAHEFTVPKCVNLEVQSEHNPTEF